MSDIAMTKFVPRNGLRISTGRLPPAVPTVTGALNGFRLVLAASVLYKVPGRPPAEIGPSTVVSEGAADTLRIGYTVWQEPLQG